MASFDLAVEFRGSFTGRAKPSLERAIAGTLHNYFQVPPTGVDLPRRLEVMVDQVKPGGDPNKLVRVRSAPPAHDHRSVLGVPVVIHIEGTQGAFCSVAAPNMNPEALRKILAGGPYRRRSVERASVLPPGFVPTETVVTERVPATVVSAEAPTITASPERSGCSVLDRLRAYLQSPEYIEQLKATMATILVRHLGSVTPWPNETLVPVGIITEAIYEHMGLPRNEALTYKGVVGNFYATRIALFGRKSESKSAAEVYTDWYIDVSLVLDFTEGRNNLEALAKQRAIEVNKRREREDAEKEKGAVLVLEPVTDVQQLSLEQLTSLLKAGRWRREEAQQQLALANENVAVIQAGVEELEAEMQRLQERLLAARADVVAAEELRKEAEKHLQAVSPTPEQVLQLKVAQERITELLAEFGS